MTITVIGAGVAGLTAARDLARAGAAVRVLEAQAQPGGMLAAVEFGSVRVDIGAEAYAVRGGVVDEFLTELGLGDDIVEPRELPTWTFQDGEAYPLPEGALFGIPAGPEGLEAALGDTAVVAREPGLPAEVGADATNLAELVLARYDKRVLHRLVTPLTRGIYSLTPEEVRLERLLPGVLDQLRELGSLTAVVAARRSGAPLVRSLRGGMHRLVTTLVADCERLGVEFRYGEQVSTLDELDGPVVVTVPPSASLPYLGDFRAPAPVSSDVVVMLLDAPELDDFPRGTGVLVVPDDPAEPKALTHVSAKWPWLGEQLPAGQHVVRLNYPPSGLGADIDRHLADASAILGVPLEASRLLGHERRIWQMPASTTATHAAGRPDTPPAGIHPTGTWIAGTGLASVIPHARAAAQRALAG